MPALFHIPSASRTCHSAEEKQSLIGGAGQDRSRTEGTLGENEEGSKVGNVY